MATKLPDGLKKYSITKFSQNLRKEAKKILVQIRERFEITYQVVIKKNKIHNET